MSIRRTTHIQTHAPAHKAIEGQTINGHWRNVGETAMNVSSSQADRQTVIFLDFCLFYPPQLIRTRKQLLLLAAGTFYLVRFLAFTSNKTAKEKYIYICM